jgi:phosphoenolpyruvate carboxykinase (ATP)
VASAIPGVDDDELLRPRSLYERQGRLDEYETLVATVKAERADYLAKFATLDPKVATSSGV